ncbi:unnamed protein product [Ambrosiozyma monospora]|uniref:Unnamed protein product n=1 Tax=Ambrosiozyma monospora TaxID=43982 RepID=A0ACB5T2V5_AMBMO|nr:unnamed protein product [Ambrosiozyma monospora]
MGSVVQHFPKHQRSTVMGIAESGGCIGGVLYPAVLTKSYKTISFTWSMRCVAFVTFVCYLIAIICVKEKKLPEKESLNTKQKLKLYMTKSFDLKTMISDRRYFFTVCVCTLGESSVSITGGFFSFIAVKNGFTESESFLLVTVMNVISVFGRYFSGYIADKSIGTFATLIVLLVLTGLTDLGVWMPFKSSTIAIWLYAIIYGFLYGGILALLSSEVFHTVRADVFGSRYATQYGVAGMVFLGMMPAAASIIRSGESSIRNDGFIALMAVSSFLSAACYFVARTMTVGFTLKKF